MGKTCTFKTKEASTKAWFIGREILSTKLEIKEGKLAEFRKYNKIFSDSANELYNLELEANGKKPMLFYEENGGKKAVPNTKLFHQVDAQDGVFYPENMKYKGTTKKAPLEAVSVNQEDLENLRMTTEVIKYLYGQSSKKMTISSYAQQAQRLVANLKSNGFTNEEILTKLNCL
jgi:hypothetical protein